jgi:cytochrome P450
MFLRASSDADSLSSRERGLPICTLPMLGGKMYIINSPTLIQAAMRSRNISFDPFSLEFASGALGMTKHHIETFEPEMDNINHVIHSSLSGDPVYMMNARALKDVARTLNDIKPGAIFLVNDLFAWLRELMSMATMIALFGEKNPIDREVISLVWEYEKAVGLLGLDIAPKLLAPKALAARKKAQAILTPYYVARDDERDDVSAFVKRRAKLQRDLGISSQDLGIIEFTLPWVSTTNTIPTLFWLFVTIFSKPAYTERIRDEVAQITTVTATKTGREASLDITKLEKSCPFLMACYRESHRLYNDNTGNRRVLQDTTIRDADGREYLLKKGINVQWSAGISHTIPQIWGEDFDSFNPERYMDPDPADEKKRRNVMIPFGGGRNLCPGRMFALAENLGFISTVALGFDVEGVKVPSSSDPYLGTAMRRPDYAGLDPSVRIKRRAGWEDVTWSFVC